MKQKISIVILAGMALVVSYWTGYVHGSGTLATHEKIISVTLPMIFIWTLAKLTFAFYFGRNNAGPSGGGSEPPPAGPSGAPVPRPPGVPPVIRCEEAA